MPSARSAKLVATPAAPVAVGRPFVPSALQMAIFDWFRDSPPGSFVGRVEQRRNLLVRARAGAGKTETILRGIEVAPEQNILLAAFNKRNQEDLAARLNNPRAEALTLHALGFQAIRAEFGRVRVCERYERREHLADAVCKGLPYGAKRLVAELVSKAREIQPQGATLESLTELALEYDCVPPAGDPLTVEAVVGATLKALAYARTPASWAATGIDYADMIFLPIALKLMRPVYDMVVIDEYQDMTRAQASLAHRALKPGGRFVIVGDDRQSVYLFRGADSANLEAVKETLHAHELPLSITYRCPKRVVALAQRLVPDYEAAPDAPEGTVDTVDGLDELLNGAKPGDFVLSRTNAPLVRVALRLLRAGKPAKIQGRDIGASLKATIRALAKGEAAHDIQAFLRALRAYEVAQRDRLLAMKRDDRVDVLHDKCETLRWLCDDAGDVANLTARIDSLFTDEPGASVICSTVHKAKGLEAERVWALKSTFGLPVPCECGHRHQGKYCGRCVCKEHVTDAGKQREEENVQYVCWTRAKTRLTFCMERF